MTVKIRKARPDDIIKFAKNLQSVTKEGKYLFAENFMEEDIRSLWHFFHDKDCLALVAEVDGKIVGGLELGWYGFWKKMQHTRMLSMHIIKAYRGQGIGTKLVARALKWAKSRPDIQKVCLGVFSNNPRAIHLYEKFGFQPDGIKKNQYIIDGKYVDEINMARFFLR